MFKNSIFFNGLLLVISVFFFAVDAKSFANHHDIFSGVMTVVWGAITYFNAKSFLSIWKTNQ